jgi:hypothetical protein
MLVDWRTNRTNRRIKRRRGVDRLHFITRPHLAEHLGVHDKTVCKRIKAGVLPAFWFKGEWRIAKTDAIAFIKRSRFQG